MKKASLLLSLLGVAAGATAQQRPHYTQYILNNYILNPALTGIENYTDVKLSIRDQWVGLNGAPRTTYFSIHKPVGKSDNKATPTSFLPPGENPRGATYWEQYEASAPHHGIGMILMNDRTGNLNRFTANVSYAYHMGLNTKWNLSAGFSAGISKIGYDRAKATPAVAGDVALGDLNVYISKFRPDVNVGLWLYGPGFYAGLAAQQVVPQKYVVADDASFNKGKLLPHLFGTMGYRFLLTDDINATPSVMMKYVAGAPTSVQYDLNVKLQYRDLLWASGGYRIQDGYSAMLGLNVGNTFNVSYAYDFTTTPINTASRGTHELMIGFLLGNRWGDTCPRNVW
ncbi:MAG: type IX secretion system membrane protein PorP/SprF [Chitinophagaceae bacterium]|nr:MAG: type IX secretion system membrane protein PorP/SprF [Chitinophagaceae bacterium]